MLYKDLPAAGYRLLKTSAARGYVSREVDHAHPVPYSGRYGKGYTVDFPRYDTTRYVWREYWIR